MIRTITLIYCSPHNHWLAPCKKSSCFGISLQFSYNRCLCKPCECSRIGNLRGNKLFTPSASRFPECTCCIFHVAWWNTFIWGEKKMQVPFWKWSQNGQGGENLCTVHSKINQIKRVNQCQTYVFLKADAWNPWYCVDVACAIDAFSVPSSQNVGTWLTSFHLLTSPPS